MVWALVFLGVGINIPGGGLTNFFSQIIVSFGFTLEQSLLYYTPSGAVTMVSPIVWGLLSRRFGHRLLFGILGIIVSIIGAILIVALPQNMRVGKLIGFYLTGPYQTAEAAVVSLISSNVAGYRPLSSFYPPCLYRFLTFLPLRYTKKTTVSAMFITAFCVGNIIGPQTFRAKDAPRYIPAEITIVVILTACMADMLFILAYLTRRNRQKEENRQRDGYVKQKGIRQV